MQQSRLVLLRIIPKTEGSEAWPRPPPPPLSAHRPGTRSPPTRARRSGCSACSRRSRSARTTPSAQYGLLEIVVPEGVGSPWHVHPEEDEWFYVLDGKMTFWVADTQISMEAGSFAFGPKGVPHTFYAEAGGAKALVGFAPMQFEGFQREVGEPAPERVAATAAGRPPRHRTARSRSHSETGSRSSAPRAHRPDTEPSQGMGASAPVRDPAPGPARLERWGKREIVVLDEAMHVPVPAISHHRPCYPHNPRPV